MPATRELELVRRARTHGDRIAVVAPEGLFTYRDLLAASGRVAGRLLAAHGETAAAHGEAGADAQPERIADLDEARVAYLIPPGFQHVAVQWGIWRAGGVAVPLAVSYPPRELAYLLDDADPAAVVVRASLAEGIAPLAEQRGIPLLDSADLCETEHGPSTLPSPEPGRPALMIYTSGTTGRPKGVVTTHANVRAQVASLVEAWRWSADDHILLVLPLHHVHGVVNVLTCALWSGACCQMLPRFDPAETLERFARADLTLFMAVPTVYAQLTRAWEEGSATDRERWSAGARAMRLMVSGSAALPVRVLERWRELTGHVLLERYGMTEIGMGLSNPLVEEERVPGHVGQPLPGVEVRRVDAAGQVVADPAEPGELHIRGPGVFREYWRRPEETSAAFHDGWFATGDVAVVEDGHYRLLGRTSVDIIKTGGYKVSALEVEEILREHECVRDCAVVGVPDPEWGERICVALTVHDDTDVDPDEVMAWARDQLAPYKAPRECLVLDELPRNAMGKVMKPDVKALFESSGEAEADRGSES